MTQVMLPLPHRRLWRWLSVLLVAGVIASSLIPGGASLDAAGADKVAHGGTYLLLAVWFAGLSRRAAWPWIGGALLLLGFALEVAQRAMALGRVEDPRDLLANATGIAAGMLLAYLGAHAWAQRLETWLATR